MGGEGAVKCLMVKQVNKSSQNIIAFDSLHGVAVLWLKCLHFSMLIHFTDGLPLTPPPSCLTLYTPHKFMLLHSHHVPRPSQCTMVHMFHYSMIHHFTVTPLLKLSYILSLLSPSHPEMTHAPPMQLISAASNN